MKKFEYFISFNFLMKDGRTGFGSGIYVFDFNIDEQDYNADTVNIILKEIMSRNSSIENAVPLYYHLRRIISD